MRTLLSFFVASLALAVPLLAAAQEFTPLTNLPGIEGIADQETLPEFLNNLYRLCIGAAAVIAVLQIMRAGAYFMFNKGSVAHNEQAKSLIANSVLGLLLVLSPAIVFGIINPDILELNLDVSELQPEPIERTLEQGEVVSVLKSGLQDGATCADVAEEDRARCQEVFNQCVAQQGRPVLNTGQNECASDATACRGSVRCVFDTGTPAQTPPAQTEPTEAVANREYELRIRYLNERGEFARSVGRRFPSQQQCTAYFTEVNDEVSSQHPGWYLDPDYNGCDCSQPRTTFPACRN